mgnify:CR=1 FL=1|jgi:hypothetical protein
MSVLAPVKIKDNDSFEEQPDVYAYPDFFEEVARINLPK